MRGEDKDTTHTHTHTHTTHTQHTHTRVIIDVDLESYKSGKRTDQRGILEVAIFRHGWSVYMHGWNKDNIENINQGGENINPPDINAGRRDTMV